MRTDAYWLPDLVRAITATLQENAEAVTALDQTIGDGDHVDNLQRGVAAVAAQATELSTLEWGPALQKIGMAFMTKVGGASGSLFGTLFVSLGKAATGRPLTLPDFADSYAQAVEAVKRRGKSDVGEKTLLDVLVPVAGTLQRLAAESAPLAQVLEAVTRAAEAGAEATRDMLPTKGRASFLGERARGCVDPGAKTSQLMIAAIARVLAGSAAPA
jgi:dihydroxyacetone kinase-like protein